MEYICFLSQLEHRTDKSDDHCECVCVCACVYLSIRTGVGADSVSSCSISNPVSHFCASATESARNEKKKKVCYYVRYSYQHAKVNMVLKI